MITPSTLLLAATLLPLASFIVLIFFGSKFGKLSAGVATTAILLSFSCSVAALILWVGHSDPQQLRVQAITIPWLTLNSLPFAPGGTFEVGILVDSLTLTMFVMICLVATLVHIFSMAYLAGDSRFSRFFAYLGLFCFSMLGLVLSDSLLQLFVFWELVGVCSYLLIGFWFEKRGPALASKKAMITNRIGDAGFLVGLGLLVWQIGPTGLTLYRSGGDPGLAASVQQVTQTQIVPELSSATTSSHVASSKHERHEAGENEIGEVASLQKPLHPEFMGLSWLTWAGICLCIGAIAKSAQFPLHVWLPDAMEGPTPVSALIHAATMVAAGVYLVARIYPILTLDARLFMAIIGCTTLTMGALIALVMTDIKKVLAYSTISQLGFMMLFLGCGGYVAGLFHLVTHAFFKACLFLGSGSVIAACHHEQEITKMGGLWRKIPVTALTFGLAVLAIAGTPFFSGYYSKDLGLAGVYEYAMALHQPAGTFWFVPRMLFWIPTIAAYFTAFYMTRVWWLTFGGKPRNQDIFEHAKEHPLMTLPLIVLGILAVVAGYDILQIKELILRSAPLQALVYNISEEGEGVHAVHKYVFWAFLVGPTLAILIYFSGFGIADRIRRLPFINLLYIWLKNKMYFDHLYEGVLVNLSKIFSLCVALFDKYIVDGVVNLAAGITRLLSWISGQFDRGIIDGIVNGLAVGAQGFGWAIRQGETGRIRFYVLSMITVITVVAAGLVFVWARWM